MAKALEGLEQGERVSGEPRVFGSLVFAFAFGVMEFQCDVDESISMSSGSLSPDLGDMWMYGCPKSLWDSDICIWTEDEEISGNDTRSLRQVLEGPCREGLWPFLDPWDVVEMRTTASIRNIPSKYGSHGALFLFLIKKEPTICGEVVDFERKRHLFRR